MTAVANPPAPVTLPSPGGASTQPAPGSIVKLTALRCRNLAVGRGRGSHLYVAMRLGGRPVATELVASPDGCPRFRTLGAAQLRWDGVSGLPSAEFTVWARDEPDSPRAAFLGFGRKQLHPALAGREASVLLATRSEADAALLASHSTLGHLYFSFEIVGGPPAVAADISGRRPPVGDATRASTCGSVPAASGSMRRRSVDVASDEAAPPAAAEKSAGTEATCGGAAEAAPRIDIHGATDAESMSATRNESHAPSKSDGPPAGGCPVAGLFSSSAAPAAGAGNDAQVVDDADGGAPTDATSHLLAPGAPPPDGSVTICGPSVSANPPIGDSQRAAASGMVPSLHDTGLASIPDQTDASRKSTARGTDAGAPAAQGSEAPVAGVPSPPVEATAEHSSLGTTDIAPASAAAAAIAAFDNVADTNSTTAGAGSVDAAPAAAAAEAAGPAASAGELGPPGRPEVPCISDLSRSAAAEGPAAAPLRQLGASLGSSKGGSAALSDMPPASAAGTDLPRGGPGPAAARVVSLAAPDGHAPFSESADPTGAMAPPDLAVQSGTPIAAGGTPWDQQRSPRRGQSARRPGRRATGAEERDRVAGAAEDAIRAAQQLAAVSSSASIQPVGPAGPSSAASADAPGPGLAAVPLQHDGMSGSQIAAAERTLTIDIQHATNLIGRDLGSAGDPFVVVAGVTADAEVMELVQSTVCWSTNEPVWNQKVAVPDLDPRFVAVEVSLFDYDEVGEHDFLGWAALPVDLASGRPAAVGAAQVTLVPRIDENNAEDEAVLEANGRVAFGEFFFGYALTVDRRSASALLAPAAALARDAVAAAPLRSATDMPNPSMRAGTPLVEATPPGSVVRAPEGGAQVPISSAIGSPRMPGIAGARVDQSFTPLTGTIVPPPPVERSAVNSSSLVSRPRAASRREAARRQSAASPFNSTPRGARRSVVLTPASSGPFDPTTRVPTQHRPGRPAAGASGATSPSQRPANAQRQYQASVNRRMTLGSAATPSGYWVHGVERARSECFPGSQRPSVAAAAGGPGARPLGMPGGPAGPPGAGHRRGSSANASVTSLRRRGSTDPQPAAGVGAPSTVRICPGAKVRVRVSVLSATNLPSDFLAHIRLRFGSGGSRTAQEKDSSAAPARSAGGVCLLNYQTEFVAVAPGAPGGASGEEAGGTYHPFIAPLGLGLVNHDSGAVAAEGATHVDVGAAVARPRTVTVPLRVDDASGGLVESPDVSVVISAEAMAATVPSKADIDAAMYFCLKGVEGLGPAAAAAFAIITVSEGDAEREYRTPTVAPALYARRAGGDGSPAGGPAEQRGTARWFFQPPALDLGPMPDITLSVFRADAHGFDECVGRVALPFAQLGSGGEFALPLVPVEEASTALAGPDGRLKELPAPAGGARSGPAGGPPVVAADGSTVARVQYHVQPAVGRTRAAGPLAPTVLEVTVVKARNLSPFVGIDGAAAASRPGSRGTEAFSNGLAPSPRPAGALEDAALAGPVVARLSSTDAPMGQSELSTRCVTRAEAQTRGWCDETLRFACNGIPDTLRVSLWAGSDPAAPFLGEVEAKLKLPHCCALGAVTTAELRPRQDPHFYDDDVWLANRSPDGLGTVAFAIRSFTLREYEQRTRQRLAARGVGYSLMLQLTEVVDIGRRGTFYVAVEAGDQRRRTPACDSAAPKFRCNMTFGLQYDTEMLTIVLMETEGADPETGEGGRDVRVAEVGLPVNSPERGGTDTHASWVTLRSAAAGRPADPNGAAGDGRDGALSPFDDGVHPKLQLRWRAVPLDGTSGGDAATNASIPPPVTQLLRMADAASVGNGSGSVVPPRFHSALPTSAPPSLATRVASALPPASVASAASERAASEIAMADRTQAPVEAAAAPVPVVVGIYSADHNEVASFRGDMSSTVADALQFVAEKWGMPPGPRRTGLRLMLPRGVLPGAGLLAELVGPGEMVFFVDGDAQPSAQPSESPASDDRPPLPPAGVIDPLGAANGGEVLGAPFAPTGEKQCVLSPTKTAQRFLPTPPTSPPGAHGQPAPRPAGGPGPFPEMEQYTAPNRRDPQPVGVSQGGAMPSAAPRVTVVPEARAAAGGGLAAVRIGGGPAAVESTSRGEAIGGAPSEWQHTPGALAVAAPASPSRVFGSAAIIHRGAPIPRMSFPDASAPRGSPAQPFGAAWSGGFEDATVAGSPFRGPQSPGRQSTLNRSTVAERLRYMAREAAAADLLAGGGDGTQPVASIFVVVHRATVHSEPVKSLIQYASQLGISGFARPLVDNGDTEAFLQAPPGTLALAIDGVGDRFRTWELSCPGLRITVEQAQGYIPILAPGLRVALSWTEGRTLFAERAAMAPDGGGAWFYKGSECGHEEPHVRFIDERA